VLNIKNETEIYIYNNVNNKIYVPIVKDKITWSTERKGIAGKLTFTVVKDSIIDFNEGSKVIFRYNNQNVFCGYVFSKSRDKEQHISVVAYDQLRYLKNKHTYVYENKTADEIVRMIASDFLLQVGEFESTNYKIASKIEDNSTLFDIIQNALNDTLLNRNQIFVLYDNFGSLTLKNAANMLIPTDFIIDSNSAQNFDYKTDIDNQTYNRIQLYADDTETNKREFYTAQDAENINRWGILQLTEKLNGNENANAKAAAMLSLYNNVQRNLTINNAFGDLRAFAGSSIFVALNLGDLILNDYMFIEKATHEFSNNLHTMSLNLRKNSFVV
jgi:Phage late control gene D protein (GPD).